MSIAPKLRHYLDAQRIDYEVLEHRPTVTAMQNAEACQIPAERLAKAVLLDTPDDYILAVLPSNRRIGLADLRTEVGEKPQLADEVEVARIFDDCAVGAVPPVGFGYGVITIVDDSLSEQPDIYFEGGDHVSLIHMEQPEFARLIEPARHGRFSETWADSG
jgi:Ala-tRNA(Pro) deacylase